MVPTLKFRIVEISPDPHAIYPRLRVKVNVRAENVNPQGEYIGLEDLKLDLSVLNEGGTETHLPTANSEQGLYLAYTMENSIQFHLDLDYLGLAQIEKIRNNKDLRLRAKLYFTSEIPSQYKYKNSGFQPLPDYPIPKSTWIEHILSAFNFKNVFLLELPKLIENADTTKVSVHLNNALDKLSSGDYTGVLIDCHKALEETKALAKSRDYVKVINDKEKIDFGKFTDTGKIKEALENVWTGVWNFPQPGGRHIGRDRSKEDAQFAILTTFGFVDLIVNSMLAGQT